jgi:hypothetical protein
MQFENTTEVESSGSEAITSIDQIREKVESMDPPVTETTDESTKESAVESEEAVEPEADKKEDAEKPAVEAAPEYKPDYKFKASSKEYEIPEKFKSLIKTKEDEAEVKDILSKAYGIDSLKSRLDSTSQENEYIKSKVLPEYAKQDEVISELTTYVEKKDFGSYFDRLGIDRKDVMEWMYQELSLTPEQRKLYDQNRELQKQVYQRQMESQQLKSQVDQTMQEKQQALVEQTRNALDFTLSKGDFKDAVQTYDGNHGAGAFQKKVIEYAAFKANTEGRNLTVEEAVRGVKELLVPATVHATTTVQTKAVQKDKPTLPVVPARAQSPSGKQITSIKQLRAKANSFQAEQ